VSIGVGSFDSYEYRMHWHSPGPVRHPPGFVAPCLPTNASIVPTGPIWAYEIKHDGYRFICRRDGDRVRVFSRRGNDHTDRTPAIAEALLALHVKSVTSLRLLHGIVPSHDIVPSAVHVAVLINPQDASVSEYDTTDAGRRPKHWTAIADRQRSDGQRD
jgi:hypothetical protein